MASLSPKSIKFKDPLMYIVEAVIFLKDLSPTAENEEIDEKADDLCQNSRTCKVIADGKMGTPSLTNSEAESKISSDDDDNETETSSLNDGYDSEVEARLIVLREFLARRRVAHPTKLDISYSKVFNTEELDEVLASVGPRTLIKFLHGWTIDYRRRKSGAIDKFYYHKFSTKQFRSMVEVKKFIRSRTYERFQHRRN